jgi:hypothetical protein
MQQMKSYSKTNKNLLDRNKVGKLPGKYVPKHVRVLVGIDRTIRATISCRGANPFRFFIGSKGKSRKA